MSSIGGVRGLEAFPPDEDVEYFILGDGGVAKYTWNFVQTMAEHPFMQEGYTRYIREVRRKTRGFYVNSPEGKNGLDLPRISTEQLKEMDPDKFRFIPMLLRADVRAALIQECESLNFRPALGIFHPTAFVDLSANLENPYGTNISPNALIDKDSHVGAYATIANNTTVGHDALVGRFCSLFSNSLVGGECVLGDCVEVGSGASINHGVRVGANCKIAMGAAVFKDMPDNSSAVGNPARITVGSA